MPRRHLHAPAADGTLLRDALRRLRLRLEVPEDFPPDVLAEARQAAANPRMPEADATDLPLFTIDPPSSTDLDQAMHLAVRGDGYRVHYAIADVAAFVTPGGALDAEAHRRVTTLYFPDERVPLHPQVLSEGAASLLPGQDRPALLWRIDLDAAGRVTATDVRRARVRSRAKLDYATVQRSIDAGTAEEPVALLQRIGLLREALERDRGGISLNVPEQEIEQRPDGDGYVLDYRAPLPAEGWNAQISLLTGMAAADLMIRSGTGILRTLPAAPASAADRLRRVATALRIDWPAGTPYPDLIRSLDPHRPDHAAFLQECTSLLRGAGYTVLDGTASGPTEHAAVAAPYTHCTAPLRRLVDRYAGEICLSLVAGDPLPEWVGTALPALPKEMSAGTQHANRAERECVDLIEAALLEDRVGEVFDAFVIDLDDRDPTSGTIHLKSPAVVAKVRADPAAAPLPLGRPLRVRLTAADPATSTVLFAPADQPGHVD
ncbi:RNB domain-containing ribonuclease [Streptomyces sp. NPDC006733]|uniref:RNB domain-containing ribonuclease n=1 Tax=Streptomyces sp. NPDC006733 TaxID=3155460 RepID=UPI003408B226